MTLIRFCLLCLISTPVVAAPHFVHCYDYGCKTTVEVRYDAAQWQEIREIFADGIEHDWLEFVDGQSVSVRIANRTLRLVIGIAASSTTEAAPSDHQHTMA